MSCRVLMVFANPEMLSPFRDLLMALAQEDDFSLDVMVLSNPLDTGWHGWDQSIKKHVRSIDFTKKIIADSHVVRALMPLYRQGSFDLIVHVTSRIVIGGGVAAWLSSVHCPIVHLFPGMGYLFTENRSVIRVLRACVGFFLKWLFRRLNGWALVQNEADHALLESMMPAGRVATIAGCGIDTRAFPFSPEPPPEKDGTVRAVLAARMISHKGIIDLVEASRILKKRHVKIRVILVGPCYPTNPSAIDLSQLRSWHEEGLIEYQGERQDMAQVITSSHMAVLPSYREGLPRFLLEAASCGRPIIASDIPGCRDIVHPMTHGLLVPPGDVRSLACALERLSTDSQLRQRMGKACRSMVVEKFDTRIITRRYVDFLRMVKDV